VFEDIFNADWFAGLSAEGLAARSRANVQLKQEPENLALRRGDPNRHLASAEGGPVQTAIYNNVGLIQKLSECCGRKIRPTGGQGTYSYYDLPGHFLGLHRDIRRCDVTLITCLHRQGGDFPSGALRVYAKSAATSLSKIGSHTWHRDIRMSVGQSVLLLGGCVPHEVLPAAKGYARHISVLCFEIRD
jgi:hypothetical protein